MTIQELLQEIISAANWTETVSFYGGVKSEHNLLHDERKFPAVLLIEPIVSNDVVALSGLITPTYDLMLLFGAKSELDWDQAKHDVECIIPMRKLSRKFIIAATTSKKIKQFANSRRTNFINLFDVTMSGVMMTCSITPENTEDLCL